MNILDGECGIRPSGRGVWCEEVSNSIILASLQTMNELLSDHL